MDDKPDLRSSWTPTGRSILLVLLAGGVLACVVVMGLGGMGQFALLVLSAVLVLPVVSIELAAAALISDAECRRQSVAPRSRVFWLAMLFVAIQFVGFFGSIVLDEYRSARAMAWCDGLTLHLEAWRSQHGEYPESLDRLGLELDPPLYCRSGLMYRVWPDGYVFDFFDDGWLSGWAYSSKRGEWAHYD